MDKESKPKPTSFRVTTIGKGAERLVVPFASGGPTILLVQARCSMGKYTSPNELYTINPTDSCFCAIKSTCAAVTQGSVLAEFEGDEISTSEPQKVSGVCHSCNILPVTFTKRKDCPVLQSAYDSPPSMVNASARLYPNVMTSPVVPSASSTTTDTELPFP